METSPKGVKTKFARKWYPLLHQLTGATHVTPPGTRRVARGQNTEYSSWYVVGPCTCIRDLTAVPGPLSASSSVPRLETDEMILVQVSDTVFTVEMPPLLQHP